MKPFRFPIKAQILALSIGATLVTILSFVVLVVSLFSRDRMNLITESQRAHLAVLSQELEGRFRFALLASEGSRARFKLQSSDYSDTWRLIEVEGGDSDTPLKPLREALESKNWSQYLNAQTTLVPVELKNETPSLTLIQSSRSKALLQIKGALLDSSFFQSLLKKHSTFKTDLVDVNGRRLLSETQETHLNSDWITSQWNERLQEVSTQLENPKILIAFKRLENFPFALVSTVEEAPLRRTFFELYWKSLLLGMFLLLIFGAISFRFGSLITVPLSKLLDSMRALTRGEPIQTLYLKARHEIADLTLGFNAMAVELQNRKISLERQNEELERRVSERTKELQEEKSRLHDAQDALLKSTRLASLGEMAGITAHEVLNPINNIQIHVESQTRALEQEIAPRLNLLHTVLSGWEKSFQTGGVETLMRELNAPTADGRALVVEDFENLLGSLKELSDLSIRLGNDHTKILTEVQRVTRLVNQMRGLARVSGDRKTLDIHTPLSEGLITLKESARKRNIRLIEDYSSDPRSSFLVSADGSELLQVFSNLIRNSFHAVSERHPTDGGWVRIRTRQTDEWVTVEVEDNGSGIAPSAQARVFEPDYTTKGVEEGTGLGLSISRRIIRAFDGDLVLLRSSPGEGTCFSIRLPHAK